MADTPHVCRTCRFAMFEKTPTGKFRKDWSGLCLWPVPKNLPLPLSITRQLPDRGLVLHKGCIWPQDETLCPVWEAPRH